MWSAPPPASRRSQSTSNCFLKTVSGTSTTDTLGKGGGTRTYQVCNAGSATCSNTVTVTY